MITTYYLTTADIFLVKLNRKKRIKAHCVSVPVLLFWFCACGRCTVFGTSNMHDRHACRFAL